MRRFVVPILVGALLSTVCLVTATTASAELGFLPLTKEGIEAEGGTVTIATGASSITCAKSDRERILISTRHHFFYRYHFLSCKTSGFAVNSLGAKPEEILIEREWLACLINSASLVFGIYSEVVGNAHLEVPVVGLLISLSGAVIGEVTTKGKAKVFTVNFSGEKGKQAVTECKDEAGNVKKAGLTIEENESKKPAAASENWTAKVEFEEEVELMDK
jgi:hypothetical protein